MGVADAGRPSDLAVATGPPHSATERKRPQLAAVSSGAICGSVFGLCRSVVLWAFLAETLAPFALEALPRRLQRYDDGGPEWVKYEGLVRIGIIILVAIFQAVGLYIYWRSYVRHSATKFVPPNAMTPADMMGRWAYGEFDCCSAMSTFWCFLFCHICSVSDLWYRAGFVHGIMEPGQENPCTCCEPCPGWPYFIGGCLYFFVEGCGCLPCMGAFLRGGVRWIDGGNGGMDTPDLRLRFGIPNDGFCTFFSDCCCWAWCGPCLGTQEYRQIMALLDRGQLATVQASVVGAPVQVVMGSPVQAFP